MPPRVPRPREDCPESTLLSRVTRLARQRGWLVYHTANSQGSQPGFPDLVLVRGDRVLWAELKAKSGWVRPEQRQWLDALAAAGQTVRVWRPSDWREITAALD